MPLITLSQVTYFPPIFEPEYETGSHGVTNPLTGAIYGAFGLTVVDYEQRSARLERLWGSTHVKGAAQKNRQKFAPTPEPDFVEEFPPEDTRGIVAIIATPDRFSLQVGHSYDLTLELILGNKTPTDVTVDLTAVDLTEGNDTVLILSHDHFLLPSGTDAVVSLAVKLSSMEVGTRTLRIEGGADFDIMVQPEECVLDTQPYYVAPAFYQVAGPETYVLAIGDSLDLAFTTTNGMGGAELWGFSDFQFLQDHNLTLDEAGVLMSSRVAGPPGLFEVAVFVEQVTEFGARLFSSKIIEILVG